MSPGTRRTLLASWLVALPSYAAPSPGEPAKETRALSERLVVHPGATCLRPDALEEQVVAWLGTDRVRADLQIAVEGSADDARAVTVRIRSGSGKTADRRFAPAPSRCEQLHAVVGLAIALSVRASLVDEIHEARVAPPPVSVRQWAVVVAPVVAAGVVPGWSWGGEVRIERALSSAFALRLGMMGVYGTGGTLSPLGGGFDVLLAATWVDACVGVAFSSRFGGRACAGFAGGVLDASGRDLPRSDRAVVRWLAVEDAVEASLALSDRWDAVLGLGLLVPIERVSFVVRNPSQAVVAAKDLAGAGALASAGMLYRF